MMEKTKSKHFVCFISKTSKTLKVELQDKKFEKIAEINNETVKKLPLLSYIKDRVKKEKKTTAKSHLHH